MKLSGDHNYYVYITTSPQKTTLYIGITNDLQRRLKEHFDASGNPETFAGKYYCYHLVYYEWFSDVNEAIKREKQLKGWKRAKKEALIERVNPKWLFLSETYFADELGQFCGNQSGE